MGVELSKYQYSYANAVGHHLKQPLFKLVSNIAISASGNPWESQVSRIKKVALHCFVGALFIIPASLSWLLGKSIAYFSSAQIDHEGLFLAPPKIVVPQEHPSDELIDIRALSEKFNRLSRDGQTDFQKECLFRLCDWTAREYHELYPNDRAKRQLFCKQLTIFLRGIIKKIDAGEVSQDQKEDILKQLAEASTRCYPTWIEVAEKLWGELYSTAETVEVKLLRFIQEYKESIILEYSQQDANAQWHALNFIRNILGTELGLNTSLNEYDPFVSNVDPIFGKVLSKWLFLQRYENVNRLIFAVQTMINSRSFDASYHGFLVNVIRNRGMKNPEDYVTEHFYTDDYKLKESGVNLMLRSIGILK